MTTILLIRHGNIEMADRVPGRMPGVHLSEKGRRQAEFLAERLGTVRIDRIAVSPLDRARETAEPLARHAGIVPEVREELNEIDFGDWTGRQFEELEIDPEWKRFHAFRNGTPVPGGELMVEVQVRMIKAVMEYNQRFPNGTVAFVSHNDPIKSVIACMLGISLDLFLRIAIETGSISAVTVDNHAFRVLSVNLTGEYAFPVY